MKPFSVEELRARVENLIEGRGIRRGGRRELQ